MKWMLSDVAEATGGELIGQDVLLEGVSSDTRKIGNGQLFIALAGERFDAHDFLPTAVAAGAAALLVSRREAVPAGANAVLVADTRLALGTLAAAWRQRFGAVRLIGLTGSNGKTTTKEMIASILQAAFGEAVLATQGNLNNDIGLPLTLLGLTDQHRAAVIEMGMNHPGEISYLTQIARPDVALITNAQRAHLEGMGTLDEVAQEKGSIFTGLGAQGIAVINADDAYARYWQDLAAPHAFCRFGLTGSNATNGNGDDLDVQGSVALHGLDNLLTLKHGNEEAQIALQIPGKHNARNAVAAAAACLAAGISFAAVAEGLKNFSGVRGRLQKRAGRNGAIILDDTYNANPDSVRAGIDVLASNIGKTVLVLGDMGEVGEGGAQYHDEVGGYAKQHGIDRLYTFGTASQQASRNFGDGAYHFEQLDDLIPILTDELTPDTTVLVKGSRFMRMERVADALSLPQES
jgi:UDP-N-acetylmuramoyl-tripeptide--D-alanyl-D-alanine ligase